MQTRIRLPVDDVELVQVLERQQQFSTVKAGTLLVESLLTL